MGDTGRKSGRKIAFILYKIMGDDKMKKYYRRI